MRTPEDLTRARGIQAFLELDLVEKKNGEYTLSESWYWGGAPVTAILSSAKGMGG